MNITLLSCVFVTSKTDFSPPRITASIPGIVRGCRFRHIGLGSLAERLDHLGSPVFCRRDLQPLDRIHDAALVTVFLFFGFWHSYQIWSDQAYQIANQLTGTIPAANGYRARSLSSD